MAIIQKSFSDLVNFTRGSAATYTDAQGRIRTAAIDEPRFTYDPVMGEALGLLLEGQATNLLLWSEDWGKGAFGNGWSTSSGFFHELVEGDHPGYEGLVNYFGPVNGQNSFNNGITQQVVSLGPAGTYFIYQDLKSVPGGEDVNCVRFLPVVNDGGVGTLGGVLRLSGAGGIQNDNFDPGDSFESQEFGSFPIGNGWYRCWIKFTTIREIGDMRVTRSFPYRGSGAITGDGVAGLLGTMAQLEEGSFPTSYIPTEGSQVTRAADLYVEPAEDWFNRNAGTFVITANTEDISRENPLAFANPIMSIGGPNRTDTITLLTRVSPDESGTGRYTRLSVAGYPGNVYTQNANFDAALTNVTTETVKVAFSYDRATGVYQIACAGEVQSYGSQVIPQMVAPPELLLGRLGIKVEPGFTANTRFQRVAYYPRALSEAELVELTS